MRLPFRSGWSSGRELLDGIARAVCETVGIAPTPPAPPEVLQTEPTPVEFERRWRRPGRPVVLKGFARDWPSARWTTGEIARRCGHRMVSCMRTYDGRIGNDRPDGFPLARRQVATFVEQLERGEDEGLYLTAPIDEWLPELAADVIPPAYCRCAPFLTYRLWLGRAGITTPLHFDLAENLFAQLSGRKRFWLYPPSHGPWMCSYPMLSGKPNMSILDPERPDFGRFPQARRLSPAEVVLEPGDVLYLPSLWWHHVRSLDRSLSLNFWWAPGLLHLPVRAADWFLRTRGLDIFAKGETNGCAVENP